MVEGRDSNLRYYEVTNAQHFEAFINPAVVAPGTAFLAGYDTRYIPLHVYGIQALNLMYDAPEARRAAPAQPSRAHDPARRRAGRGAPDHRGQRAADRRPSGAG